MIRKVHTELSKGRLALDGEPPVPTPQYVNVLADAWFAEVQAGDEWDKPTAAGTDWRVSDSGFCARSVGYDVLRRRIGRALAAVDEEHPDFDALEQAWREAQPTNPITIADAWRMNLGTMVHQHLQHLYEEAFPDATIEVTVDLRPELNGSGKVDIVIDIEIDDRPHRTVIELKTINGFGFKAAAVEFRGQPEGPKLAHKIQGAIYARGLKADRLVLGYLSLECVSVNQAQRSHLDEIGRFAAEWHYTPDQFTPWAETETKRVNRILEVLDTGALPPRHSPELPHGARIVDPATGLWTLVEKTEAGVDHIAQSGNTWLCGYCKYRDRCIADGPS